MEKYPTDVPCVLIVDKIEIEIDREIITAVFEEVEREIAATFRAAKRHKLAKRLLKRVGKNARAALITRTHTQGQEVKRRIHEEIPGLPPMMLRGLVPQHNPLGYLKRYRKKRRDKLCTGILQLLLPQAA